VIEFSKPSESLVREQHWLNWLFAIPTALRYNFSPTAGSTLRCSCTPETRAKISETNKGKSKINITRDQIPVKCSVWGIQIYIYNATTLELLSIQLAQEQLDVIVILKVTL